MFRRTSHFDPTAGVILAQVTLHNRVKVTARLVFDTGATFCMLPWKLIQELDIPINPNETIQTTTASTVETSPIVKIPKMEYLGFMVQDVSCLVRDLPPMSGVDGLLGISFLKHFKVCLDFHKGDIVLSRKV
jgi:predicted aspartyl protease